MHMMRWALAATAALGLVATSVSAEAETAFKVGVILPLSGSTAWGGRSARVAAEMAAQEINDAKLAGDSKVELVFADGACEPRSSLFPRLKERQRQLAGTLSGSEQQMLAIGRALMAKPAFILMDEPSLGLAPLIVAQVYDVVRRISRDLGIGGILVEQNVELALSVATRGYVLSRGRVALAGSAATLTSSPELHRAYLGM